MINRFKSDTGRAHQLLSVVRASHLRWIRFAYTNLSGTQAESHPPMTRKSVSSASRTRRLIRGRKKLKRNLVVQMSALYLLLPLKLTSWQAYIKTAKSSGRLVCSLLSSSILSLSCDLHSMCTQMTVPYSPPIYSRDDYNSFLPPYYLSSMGTYTTTATMESFSSDQPICDAQSPYFRQFTQFSPEVSKNLTDTYTYGGPTEVYTYAYLPSQPLYFDLSPFPWAETTPHPSPGSPHINPQALSAPSSKPASTFATDPKADTVKRQRDLQKNRVAATKCRSKKKLYIQQLQSRFEDLSLAKRELQCQVQMLRNGLISLKEELVRHARCGDEPITSYIEKRRARCT